MVKLVSSYSYPRAASFNIGKCSYCDHVHILLLDSHGKPIAEFIVGDVEAFIHDLRNPEMIEDDDE